MSELSQAFGGPTFSCIRFGSKVQFFWKAYVFLTICAIKVILIILRRLLVRPTDV